MAIPKAEADLVIWFNNFSNVLDSNGPLLGFTARRNRCRPGRCGHAGLHDYRHDSRL